MPCPADQTAAALTAALAARVAGIRLGGMSQVATMKWSTIGLALGACLAVGFLAMNCATLLAQ